MRTILDGKPVQGCGSTLGAALRAVRDLAGDRLVVSVEIDGRPVPTDDLSNPPTTDPYGTELRVHTAEACVLVRDSLMFASGAVRELVQSQKLASELIHASRTAEAMDELGKVLVGWEQAKQVLELVRTLRASGTPGLPPVPALVGPEAGGVSGLAQQLESIKRCLRDQDWAALADVLAYDLPALNEAWGAMLGEMAVECAAPAPSPATVKGVVR